MVVTCTSPSNQQPTSGTVCSGIIVLPDCGLLRLAQPVISLHSSRPSRGISLFHGEVLLLCFLRSYAINIGNKKDLVLLGNSNDV